jgi:hypothetical protein
MTLEQVFLGAAKRLKAPLVKEVKLKQSYDHAVTRKNEFWILFPQTQYHVSSMGRFWFGVFAKIIRYGERRRGR